MNQNMRDEQNTSSEIKETDIVFDCPHCDKSLAIDYRGAGLTIPCTDCGNMVEVPIPDGMALSDIDALNEEQEVQIINLRRALAAAEFKIEQLEAEIKRLTAKTETLEKKRTKNVYCFGTILEKVGAMQESLEHLSKGLKAISEAAAEET